MTSVIRAPIWFPPTRAGQTGPVSGRDLPGDLEDDPARTFAASGQGAMGPRIIVHARVFDEAVRSVPGLLVEVWQPNSGGRYRPEREGHVARGTNIGLHTRMHFADEDAASGEDTALGQIEHQSRISAPLAEPQGQGADLLDVRLQGENDTVLLMSDTTLAGRPCILCVAITGSVPTKTNNPAVPITVSEQVESTHEAFEAGASIAHCHVRNDDQTPSSDPERFAALKEGIETHCPGMIVQFSTGGRSGAGRARGGMLPLRPDMASLSVGSNNFPTRVYENPPDLVDWLASEMRAYEVTPEIEAFDLSHILQAIRLHEAGVLYGKLYVQFVMGVKNAMPADREVFDFYVKMMAERAPDALWCAAGIGASQALVNEWAIAAGGHTRAGLEDNVRLDRDTLAPSNAALIARAADICARHERPVATPAEARKLLGLRA